MSRRLSGAALTARRAKVERERDDATVKAALNYLRSPSRAEGQTRALLAVVRLFHPNAVAVHVDRSVTR